jgi:hypothetical protein
MRNSPGQADKIKVFAIDLTEDAPEHLEAKAAPKASFPDLTQVVSPAEP